MRTKKEKNRQIRNALIASLAALFVAVVAAAVAGFVFNSGLMAALLVLLISFAIVLSVLIFLWKKTDLLRKLMYAFYLGKHPKETLNYYCPCCNRRLAGFSDAGLSRDTEIYNPARFVDQRQDVICPFCYSAPRQRILANWAENNKDMLVRSKILYFAPEYSMMKWFGKNGVKLTTADLFDPRADLKLDITNIDLKDCMYDIVICNHVLEHVSSYEKALSELNRILVPGGKLIISFPIDPTLSTVFEQETNSEEERLRLFGQRDHVRVFGNDSDEIIRKFGFDVSVIDTSNMPDSILPVTGPADYDSNQIFYCVKGTK